MKLIAKLQVLADAAKYDASCSSSGSKPHAKTAGAENQGIGSITGTGICHSYTPDGRCVSLLKILLTNFCIYDCLYCINRKSSNVQRARFTAKEVVDLTMDFYRRNCIEGLFLSSGIIQSPDYTMEQLVEVARSLREDHHYRGYIHLKTIPDAAPELIALAGKYADRLSINIELPTETGLEQLAPEKNGQRIRWAMGEVAHRVEARQLALQAQKQVVSLPNSRAQRAAVPRFAPGGQSTQMIVGADRASDADILRSSSQMYTGYGLRRVYYSAYSPIPDASLALPPQAPPLLREHRLYQADWLMRFYGYEASEITAGQGSGMLDLEVDPKLAWALGNRHAFPVDLNRAPKNMLLRVPGMGPRSVQRLLMARRHRRIRLEDLQQLRIPLQKAMPFIVVDGPRAASADLDSERLRQHLLQATPNPTGQRQHSGMQLAQPTQASLF